MRYLKLGIGMMLLLALLIPMTFAQESKTIIDGIVASTETEEAEFSVLLELVQAAELTDTLADEESEFTVFAPTDEAFEVLLGEFDVALEELLESPDVIQNILLYHVVEGLVSAEDILAADSIATVQGSEISVSVDEDGNVILDDIAMVIMTDIEASNGVIHVIDAVLLPPDDGTGGAEVCIVSTTSSDTVRVRVGPGNNRTSVTFLPTNVEFTPFGQAEDDDGNLWFQLDKETAAPGRAINEAWVAADELDISGDCDAVGNAAPPPIIPIINQPPPAAPQPESNSGDSGSGDTGGESGGGETTQETGTLPTNGTYTLVLASESHGSCQGGSSIPIPSSELFVSTTFRLAVRSSADAIIIGSDVISYAGPGYYTGQFTEIPGTVTTIQVFTGTSSSFTGRINLSFTIDGVGCSAGTGFTASR